MISKTSDRDVFDIRQISTRAKFFQMCAMFSGAGSCHKVRTVRCTLLYNQTQSQAVLHLYHTALLVDVPKLSQIDFSHLLELQDLHSNNQATIWTPLSSQHQSASEYIYIYNIYTVYSFPSAEHLAVRAKWIAFEWLNLCWNLNHQIWTWGKCYFDCIKLVHYIVAFHPHLKNISICKNKQTNKKKS